MHILTYMIAIVILFLLLFVSLVDFLKGGKFREYQSDFDVKYLVGLLLQSADNNRNNGYTQYIMILSISYSFQLYSIVIRVLLYCCILAAVHKCILDVQDIITILNRYNTLLII